MGLIDGGVIGHTCAGQIGFKSNELLQIACIEPFTQTQLQPAQLDIENTEAKIRKIIFFI
jgi:hypothetical protein